MKSDRTIKKLSILALDEKTSRPIQHCLFYAEVVVKSFMPAPPVPLDERFNEIIQGLLSQIDSDCFPDISCRTKVTDIFKKQLSTLLTADARNSLAADHKSATSTIASILESVRKIGGGKSFNVLSTDLLNQLIEEQIKLAAAKLKLHLTANADPTPVTWAHPMGVLASDHTGYLSFDLLRLPADVYTELKKSVEARKIDIKAKLGTTIYVYPLSPEKKHFDVLESARFSEDVIFLKLEMDENKLTEASKNDGYLSIQNPDITDWRLSPASFATNPEAMVGADGCELVLPSNISLQEFNFYQVIGMPAADVHLPLDPTALGKVRPAFVNEYRLRFIPVGHGLGQILYSMPLAPGESVNLAIIDWTRRDDAQRKEQTKLDEQIIHNEHRDRTISETVNAAIQEYQHGSSFTGGIAGSYGAALGSSGAGAAIGLAGSLGGSTASSSGSRDITATTVQKLSDNITQASSAMRELQSTVVVHSAQTEHEAIETRTVANYNHSHSLTILYYEVVRHFRIVTEFVGRRPALLTNIHGGIADFVSPPIGRSHYEINWQVIANNRKLLEGVVLDDHYKEGFDIVAARLHSSYLDQANGKPGKHALLPLPAITDVKGEAHPLGAEFKYFEFNMKTGGVHPALIEGTWVEVYATLLPAAVKLKSNGAKGGGDVTDLVPFGSFAFDFSVESFVGIVPTGSVFAGNIDLIKLDIALKDTNISFEQITITGIDTYGNRHELVNKSYASGNLVMTNNGTIDLPTQRPQPIAAQPGRTAAMIEEDAKFLEFNEHLLTNRAHYERALRLGSTEAVRAFELANTSVGNGSSLLEKVDNRPLEVLGDYVAYPCLDAVWSDLIMNKVTALQLPDIAPVERLVTLPTRGVFAEAKLGHCNASEKIDNTRYWKWEKHPIPHMAPDIAPIQGVTPQVLQQNLAATQFPQPLINIVNPPNAPDPNGLASAMNVLAASNIFRDMSGRAEVADLLKKLSDNSVAIAGVAQNAATGGAGKGNNGSGATAGGVNSGNPGGGTTAGGTGPRPSGAGATAGSTNDNAAVRLQQASEQLKSQQIDNHQKILETASAYLTPDQQSEVRNAVTRSLVNNSNGSSVQSSINIPYKLNRPDFVFKKFSAVSQKTSCLYIEFGQIQFIPPDINTREVGFKVWAPLELGDKTKITPEMAQSDAYESATKIAWKVIIDLQLGNLDLIKVEATFLDLLREDLKQYRRGYTVEVCRRGSGVKAEAAGNNADNVDV